MVQTSRRSVLSLGATLGAGAALTGIGAIGVSRPVSAAASKVRYQAPAYYRFNVGDAEITIVSDGQQMLGDPATSFLGASKEEVRKELTDNFMNPTDVNIELNSFIVNSGGKLSLFDTGLGTSKMFGPRGGRLPQNIQEAGIRPEDIDAVVISHGHIDHIGGIVDAWGNAVYPNAQIYINQADFDYWTDEKQMDSKWKKGFISHARKNLLPVRDRIVFFKDGQEILPGITTIFAPGHTLGHTMFMISSTGHTFCFVGDVSHHSVLLIEKPRMEFLYDTDSKLAVKTRVKMLTTLAANRTPILAYHFQWPGYGHVVKYGDGFRYLPMPMQMVV